MSLLSLKKNEVLYPSPPPIARDVVEQYAVNRNNDLAYVVQKELHSLFVQPDYASLSEAARVGLKRMQGLAFEGCYPDTADFEGLQEHLDESSVIADTARATLEKVHQTICNRNQSWAKILDGSKELGFNGNHDLLRMWHDLAAVDRFAQDLGGRIAMFGSARLQPDSPDYRATEWLAQTLVEGMLTEQNTTEQIITGAGPGIMKAGNKGALRGVWKILQRWQEEAKGSPAHQSELEERTLKFRSQVHSAGMRIALPFENAWNSHLEASIFIKNFGPRKQGLVAATTGRSTQHEGPPQAWHGRHPAFFVSKGGFGTEDEDWEVRTLNQCKKMPRTPVLLVGGDVNAVNSYILERLVEWGTIDPKDCDIAINCQNEVEAVEQYLDYYRLHPTSRMKEILKQHRPILEKTRISASVPSEPPVGIS